MSEKPDAMIDLVAVAYRAPQETARFLRSLEVVEVPFTITVVENNSPEPDVRSILEMAWPQVEQIPTCVGARLVFNGDNVGYARACNQGASHGTAPVIALLNCDTEWRDGVGERILRTFGQQRKAGVIGPKTTDLKGRLTHSGITKDLSGRDNHRHWMAHDLGQADDVIDVPTVSGATYFILRELWNELTTCPVYQNVAPDARGAFLPTKHYFEETFCSYHAQAHGWRVVYDGGAHMIHEWNKSDPRTSSSLWNESRDYFLSACSAHGIVGHGAG